jgi:VanZ family protein
MVEGSQRSESGKEFGVIWFTVFFALSLVALIILADMGKLRFLLWLMNRFPYGDKITHFFVIGALSFLVNKVAVRLLPRQNPKRVSMIVTLTLLLLFTLEEISQAPIAGRNASFSDLAANYAGIMTFALLAWQVDKKEEDTSISKSEK